MVFSQAKYGLLCLLLYLGTVAGVQARQADVERGRYLLQMGGCISCHTPEDGFALQVGMKSDGDFLGGSMGHVIENSTGKPTESNLKAIAAYLRDPEDPL